MPFINYSAHAIYTKQRNTCYGVTLSMQFLKVGQKVGRDYIGMPN